METEKKPRGRPKKQGQTANKIVNVRPWTYYEIQRLISSKAKTHDAVITKLVVFYNKNKKNDP